MGFLIETSSSGDKNGESARGGGEGVLNKVLCGKAPVQSLTLYFFNTTFTPFVNLLLTSEWYPFHANSRAHSTLAASSHT